jgi:hypothetical protein
VTTSTTRQYRAISPSRNDQWSGKTLRSATRAKLVVPRRSSSQRWVRWKRSTAPRSCRPVWSALAWCPRRSLMPSSDPSTPIAATYRMLGSLSDADDTVQQA